ncbi:MAG: hypothetical protein WC783_00915, partial [Candidatus Paceibacterota bacterium]
IDINKLTNGNVPLSIEFELGSDINPFKPIKCEYNKVNYLNRFFDLVGSKIVVSRKYNGKNIITLNNTNEDANYILDIEVYKKGQPYYINSFNSYLPVEVINELNVNTTDVLAVLYNNN